MPGRLMLLFKRLRQALDESLATDIQLTGSSMAARDSADASKRQAVVDMVCDILGTDGL